MYIAAAFLIAGALWSAYSHYQAGMDESDINLRNAAMAEAAAESARQRAAAEEKRFRRQGEKLKSSQKVAAATSGATLESFEPVFVDTAKEMELDALTIRHQGEVEATYYTHQADISRRRASIARRKGRSAAVGSLLSGGGRTAGALG